jgi:uncharacterized protein YaaQ
MTVDLLMTAVIQDQDIDNAINALNAAGIDVTLLASSGGFLGRHNATLLIGLEASQEAAALAVLGSACRRRVDMWRPRSKVHRSHATLTQSLSVELPYSFEVERFEVF